MLGMLMAALDQTIVSTALPTIAADLGGGGLSEAWRRWLGHHLDDWDVTDPADRVALDRAVESIAARLYEEEQEHASV
ncbi:hypothetical protein KCMC57_up06280 [Kitasatospora sp. CMC57]|uniref:Uncharacterized protein n=1 Tax=Kitasatospora sp. CMC57 TaxID=3231513 RepID=A0AB33JN38_9ACTN